MMNVIIHFLNTSLEISQEYWQLKPFQDYHFQNRRFDREFKLYPQHWRDMKGKTVLTLADQIQPRSLIWLNAKGQLQLSGFTAKCVQLFAEKYNASLKMALPLKINEILHLSIIDNMTKHGQLDIPMSLESSFLGDKWLSLSYPLEIGKWIIMTPCARPMETKKIFILIITPQVFVFIIGFTIIFSGLLSLTEKLFHKRCYWLNIFVNDKVIPGLLGQSFILKKSGVCSIKLFYVLILTLGLLLSTYYSAHLKTLITKPPLQKQSKTFDDLRTAGKKILMDILDMKNLDTNDNGIMEKMQDSIVYLNNTTLYHKYRKSFNTTYSYTVTTGLWNIFLKKQTFFTHKIFCTSENIYIMDLLMLSIPLQENSMYKEALDYLIHRVHSVGLFYAWQSHTFYDMLRLGNISLRDTSKLNSFEKLSEEDLLWIWSSIPQQRPYQQISYIHNIITKSNKDHSNE
ncbi:uncharacterized protein LOC119600441 [Lucilia sericata]|uniref:uncharacterized protein LOC119600441 n=1 Tax=Lucilia sericata TaxID=13632 RepID=UPI0018A8417F|nr:uncharacterized protein LOC119600441 [Lucilia sericata]